MSTVDYSRMTSAADADAAAARAEAAALLATTDWMAIRAAETGRAIPGDIAKARAAARDLLSAS